MTLFQALKARFKRKTFPLEIRRYEASLLHPEFLNLLRFARDMDDCRTFNLMTMPGFKWREEVDAWLNSRNCKYEVDLTLRPTISEQKNDHMTITFREEQDRLEFKLTFL